MRKMHLNSFSSYDLPLRLLSRESTMLLPDHISYSSTKTTKWYEVPATATGPRRIDLKVSHQLLRSFVRSYDDLSLHVVSMIITDTYESN